MCIFTLILTVALNRPIFSVRRAPGAFTVLYNTLGTRVWLNLIYTDIRNLHINAYSALV